jgi:hypothetical protein
MDARWHNERQTEGTTAEQSRSFGFVSDNPPTREELRRQWQAMGYGPETEVHVVTDGLCGSKAVVQRSLHGRATHVLDWFHIAIRLHVLATTLAGSLMRSGFARHAIRDAYQRLRSIRHHMWHGDTSLVINMVGEIAHCLESVAAKNVRGGDGVQRVCRLLEDLWRYLGRFQEEIFPTAASTD